MRGRFGLTALWCVHLILLGLNCLHGGGRVVCLGWLVDQKPVMGCDMKSWWVYIYSTFFGRLSCMVIAHTRHLNV